MMCSKCKKRIAVVFITRMDGDKTANEGLCLVCAKNSGIEQVGDVMSKLGIKDEDLEGMSDQMTEMMALSENGEELPLFEDDSDEDTPDFEPGGAPAFPFLQNLFGQMGAGMGDGFKESKDNADGNTSGTAKKEAKGKKNAKRKYLDTYCVNLTKRARNRELDQIIGREREIYRVIQILSRRTKNNPCLIGEPGVGKTAIAEGLALRIAAEDVPIRLARKEIHLLDLTALVAGTQFRGQFESRIKGLVDEVKADGNVILFIDEVHNLVGTGDAEGSMNAANILKPALSRGEIQVIGATTFNEYRKYIEKDAALERRFQPVTVEEPSIKDAVEMLSGIKHYYENYHHVIVPKEMILTVVNLSERYITDRFLPDKAIDLLDESCAHAALGHAPAAEYEKLLLQIEKLRKEEEDMVAESPETPDYERAATIRSDLLKVQNQARALKAAAENNVLSLADLAKVIELWTGIPASRIEQEELKRLSKLEQSIKTKIIGQDEAVAAVSAAIRRSRVQISARRRPASFIFVGPTGVGKTELVKVLAGELFDTPETLIRIDMSEFMEKHSVSKMIGSPPGYIGYDEAGQLTEKVRRKPYSVLLFDEIEKAHPDVLNVLLQILDEGRITDAHGRTVNFENTVIVMTSNAGSKGIDSTLGFGKSTADISKDKALRALSDFLRPEFLSRIDEIVVFAPLGKDSLVAIAELMLRELTEPLENRGIAFSWDKSAAKALAEKASGGKHGARDLRNTIRREVEDKIASLIVDQCQTLPTNITLIGEHLELQVK